MSILLFRLHFLCALSRVLECLTEGQAAATDIEVIKHYVRQIDTTTDSSSPSSELHVNKESDLNQHTDIDAAYQVLEAANENGKSQKTPTIRYDL